MPRRKAIALVGGSAFIFGCSLTGAAVTFVNQILLARWMGARELGIYVFALSLYSLICVLVGLGYPTAAYRFIGLGRAEGDKDHMKGFIRRGRQITICASLIAGIVGGLIVLVFDDRLVPAGYRTPLLIVFLILPFYSLIRFHAAVARGFSWFVLAALPMSVLRPLFILVGISGLWLAGAVLSAGIVMFVFATVISLLMLGQFFLLRRKLKPELQGGVAKYRTRLWSRTAAPLLIIVLFTSFFPEVNIVILGLMLPPDQIAIYSVSFRIVLVIVFGLNAVDTITRPDFARYYAAGRTEELQRLTARATGLKSVGALLGVVGFAFLGEYILSIFGEAFVIGYRTLMILALAQLVRALAGPVSELLSVTGHQDYCLYVFGYTLPLTIVLNLALVPRFGIEGSAVAVLLGIIFWTVWLHVIVVRHLKIRPSILAIRTAFR
ncbi:MAG: polysaccharide biosynthesis C-terminal domain-containing protein [Gammaproteobacteria bacterium]|nr:polysaccharide biosynthesis C-terminal domain-containing protein [Gammaproteobacteria bacterium]